MAKGKKGATNLGLKNGSDLPLKNKNCPSLTGLLHGFMLKCNTSVHKFMPDNFSRLSNTQLFFSKIKTWVKSDKCAA